MKNIEDWLTASEAARLTGYNIQYILRLVRSKKVKAIKWGAAWMIDRASLLNYKKEGERRGPRPPTKRN